MGYERRYWFPLAALGFAQLIMVLAELLPGESLAAGSFTDLRALPMSRQNEVTTGSIGGTGERNFAVAVSTDTTSSATLGWLVALACVVAAVAGWYWLNLRRAGTPPRTARFVFGTLGALLALPVLDLVGALQFRLAGDVRGALLATLGLLLLAGYERSRFVVAVAGVFALVTVVFLPPVAGALTAAAVLFAAAFAALLRRRPDRPVTAADTP
jgi:heme A synthase